MPIILFVSFSEISAETTSEFYFDILPQELAHIEESIL
jgi:hypothetical protein